MQSAAGDDKPIGNARQQPTNTAAQPYQPSGSAEPSSCTEQLVEPSQASSSTHEQMEPFSVALGEGLALVASVNSSGRSTVFNVRVRREEGDVVLSNYRVGHAAGQALKHAKLLAPPRTQTRAGANYDKVIREWFSAQVEQAKLQHIWHLHLRRHLHLHLHLVPTVDQSSKVRLPPQHDRPF